MKLCRRLEFQLASVDHSSTPACVEGLGSVIEVLPYHSIQLLGPTTGLEKSQGLTLMRPRSEPALSKRAVHCLAA